MSKISRLIVEIKYQCRYVLPLWLVQLLTNWLPENRITIRLRGLLVKPFLGKCGQRLTLARGITFLNPHGIQLGDRVYLATGCWIDGMGGLVIEDEVMLSPYVVVTTSSHCFKNNSVCGGGSRTSPVRIGKGAWVASHAVIVAGATVGAGSIIGANAVVSGDIPDNVFAGGVPARVIGPRKDGVANVSSRADLLRKGVVYE